MTGSHSGKPSKTGLKHQSRRGSAVCPWTIAFLTLNLLTPLSIQGQTPNQPPLPTQQKPLIPKPKSPTPTPTPGIPAPQFKSAVPTKPSPPAKIITKGAGKPRKIASLSDSYSGGSRLSLGTTAGLTFMNYKQTNVADYTQTAMTAKVALTWYFAPKWSLGANAYYTVLALSSSREAASVRNLGTNLRIGYTLPWPSSPWRLNLMAGGFYGQMTVTGATFGYTSLYYPQLFPTLTRALSRSSAITFYVKYAPTNLVRGDLSQRELAAGMSYVHRSFILSLDWADLTFTSGAIRIQQTTSTVSAGVSF